MTDRIIPFQGVLNFRDFGGYATPNGGRIKSGRLYRSAHHGRATDADLDAIAALGVTVIVDLRRPNERRHEPSRRHPAFAGQVIENETGELVEDVLWAAMRNGEVSPDGFRALMIDYYREAPFVPRHIDLYRRYFQVLGETEGAVLIHCAAGKDRTGLLAALTHHLLGVSQDDLTADYLLTNQALAIEQQLPLMMQAMAAKTDRPPSPEVVRVAMGVEAAYLHTAVAAIEAAHGTLNAYLRDVLGVDEALRRRVTQRLLD